LQSLKKVLKETLKKTGVKQKLKANSTHLVWREVVGDKISQNVETKEIRNGVLFLEAKTPVWRNEIQLIKNNIIDKLNKKLKNNIIKDLRIK
tara:strand:+ start:2804 stop:3079 length:276 start_codon:yes stop_codon:yes gene_type:complete